MLSALEYEQVIRDAATRNDTIKFQSIILSPDFDLDFFNFAILKIFLFAPAADEWYVIEFLLQPQFLPYIYNHDNNLEFVLGEAITKERLDTINRLLQPDCITKGLDLSVENNDILRRALYTNNTTIIERLLQPDCIALGIDPAFNNNHDLQEMLRHGYLHNVAKILLQQPRVQASLTEDQRILADNFLRQH